MPGPMTSLHSNTVNNFITLCLKHHILFLLLLVPVKAVQVIEVAGHDQISTLPQLSRGINDMMAVKRMTNLPLGVDQFNQGELIHRGPLATKKKTGVANII